MFELFEDASCRNAIILSIVAGFFGWRAAIELDLPSKLHAISFAIFFGLMGPALTAMCFAQPDAHAPFQFGDGMPTIGFAVVGVVASWIVQPRRI